MGSSGGNYSNSPRNSRGSGRNDAPRDVSTIPPLNAAAASRDKLPLSFLNVQQTVHLAGQGEPEGVRMGVILLSMCVS